MRYMNWRWWYYAVNEWLFGERQTCPRRTGELGPWQHNGGLDFWTRTGWSRLENILHRLKAGWKKQPVNPHWSAWLSKSRKPRTCSFCGGIHPEDAIRLILYGWESERTDKRYKHYLYPPGYWDWRNSWQKFETQDERLKRGSVGDYTKPMPWLPTPPVKMYSMHFSKEQIERFNAILEARYGTESAASGD